MTARLCNCNTDKPLLDGICHSDEYLFPSRQPPDCIPLICDTAVCLKSSRFRAQLPSTSHGFPGTSGGVSSSHSGGELSPLMHRADAYQLLVQPCRSDMRQATSNVGDVPHQLPKQESKWLPAARSNAKDKVVPVPRIRLDRFYLHARAKA